MLPTEAEQRAVALVKVARSRRSLDLIRREMAQNVATAREHGASWADIADMLQVSRQAAQKRYDGGNSSRSDEAAASDAGAGHSGAER